MGQVEHQAQAERPMMEVLVPVDLQVHLELPDQVVLEHLAHQELVVAQAQVVRVDQMVYLAHPGRVDQVVLVAHQVLAGAHQVVLILPSLQGLLFMQHPVEILEQQITRLLQEKQELQVLHHPPIMPEQRKLPLMAGEVPHRGLPGLFPTQPHQAQLYMPLLQAIQEQQWLPVPQITQLLQEDRVPLIMP